ncbi:MAG: TRAP transporter small permease [Gammaproteobacteria bacterium]|nr:TRAP transporter small permease [Gammaproteobacteria bacterium]
MSFNGDFFYNARQGLIRIEKFLAGLSLLILLSLSLLQVILRNFFELGFSDIDVIARHLVLFITFMGAALVSEGNRHIKIDCVSSAIKESSREKLRNPLLIFSSVTCAIFFWYALQFWLDEQKYAPDNEQLALYMALILPVGFLTLSLHFFLLVVGSDKQNQQ